jgi:hypothetical protein
MPDTHTPVTVSVTTFTEALAPGGVVRLRLDALWPRYRDWFGGDRDDLRQTAALAAWAWVLTQPPTEAETSPQDRVVDEDELLAAVETAVAAEVRGNLRGSSLDFDVPEYVPGDPDASRRLGELLRGAVEKSLRQVGYTNDDVEVVWLGVGVGLPAEDIAKSLNRGGRRRAKRVSAATVQAKMDAGAALLRQVAPTELAKIRDALAAVRRGESSADAE